MTGIGAMAGALVGIILYYLLAFLLVSLGSIPHILGGIPFGIMFFEGSFGMIGVICSLIQFWFLNGIKPWAYLKGAWISSLVGGLAAIGTLYIYEWLSPVFDCPVAAEGNMIVFGQPIMIMASIAVYGIGTSIVLCILKKNEGSGHDAPKETAIL